MNELQIDYKNKGALRIFSLIVSGYSLLLSLVLCIKSALVKNYDLWFFCVLGLAVLSIVLILSLTIWQSKPILFINSESMTFNMKGKDTFVIDWAEIQQITIGISSLTITIASSKQVAVDLAELKYSDLKAVKSKIIELCENKNILFHNN